MTYEEARAFLSRLVNYEQRSPARRDLVLEPIRQLLAALGNPERRPFIHVAGTKGKGSFAAMMERVLRCAGYRTGLYTSPQLESLEERIQIGGAPISPTALAALAADVHKAFAMRGLDPGVSFFDAMTAMAFLCFEREHVDVAVVEAGMGGRTDSTNVCDSGLAVITSISYDHTKQLGNTLTSIAKEKAGIIKPGRPVISGALAPEARAIIEAACRKRDAALSQLTTDVSYRYVPGIVTTSSLVPPRVVVTTRARTWPEMALALLGEHQAANAALVVAAVERLQALGFALGDDAVDRGLAAVEWPARIEIVRRSPLVILDCAHNVASAEALANTLTTSCPEHFGAGKKPGAKTALVFSASRDKDIAGMMRVLAPCFDQILLTQYASSDRSAPAEVVLGALREIGSETPATVISDPMHAWKTAEASATANDLVCITGSLFLAGELRKCFLPGSRGG